MCKDTDQVISIACPGKWGFPGGASGKEPANTGDLRDVGLIPGLGRSPEGGHGNPLLYFCLENPMGRGAWQATVHGVTKSRTRLKQLSRSSGMLTLRKVTLELSE